METKNRLKDYFSEEQLRQAGQLLSDYQFIVLNVSLWRQQIPWGPFDRRINDNFILIVKTEKFRTVVNGKERILHPGEGMIVAEFEHQFYELAPDVTEGESFILHVLCDHPQGDNAFRNLSSPYFALSHPEEQMHSLMQIIALRNFNNSIALSYCAFWVKHLFLDFLESGQYSSRTIAPVDLRITTALAFIRKNMSNNIAVADIAESANLKEVQFRSLFLKNCGQTPLESLRKMRLTHALRLLTRYDLPLNDIAKQCGFQSLAYFCCTFRKFFGIAPEQYRRKNR